MRRPRLSTWVALQLAAVVGVVCFWIVGIWTTVPWWGTLHANLKFKIFWTVISVLVLGMVLGLNASDRRQK